MEFIETEKGKPNLLYNGYSYRKYRENKRGEVTWMCLKEKSAKCRGRVVVKERVEIRLVAHKCVPDEAGLEVKKSVMRAKKRIREEIDTPIREVFQQEIESLKGKGYAKTHLPQFSSLKSSLYDTRYRSQASKNERKKPKQVVPDDATPMDIIEAEKGKLNLLYNGYSHRKLRKNKHGEVTWVCLKDKSAKCKGRLVTKDGVEIRVIEHDCAPDVPSLEVKKSVDRPKKRDREENDMDDDMAEGSRSLSADGEANT